MDAVPHRWSVLSCLSDKRVFISSLAASAHSCESGSDSEVLACANEGLFAPGVLQDGRLLGFWKPAGAAGSTSPPREASLFPFEVEWTNARSVNQQPNPRQLS
ncbi:uncharacterized [Tachysurus ichikawai]